MSGILTKNNKCIDTENRLVGAGEMGEGGQRYRLLVVSKSWRCHVQHGDYS